MDRCREAGLPHSLAHGLRDARSRERRNHQPTHGHVRLAYAENGRALHEEAGAEAPRGRRDALDGLEPEADDRSPTFDGQADRRDF